MYKGCYYINLSVNEFLLQDGANTSEKEKTLLLKLFCSCSKIYLFFFYHLGFEQKLTNKKNYIIKIYKNTSYQNMSQKTLNITITGAAGQIAYSFMPQLLRGSAFPNTKINLRLLDIPSAEETLKGVILELQDCNYPLL